MTESHRNTAILCAGAVLITASLLTVGIVAAAVASVFLVAAKKLLPNHSLAAAS